MNCLLNDWVRKPIKVYGIRVWNLDTGTAFVIPDQEIYDHLKDNGFPTMFPKNSSGKLVLPD